MSKLSAAELLAVKGEMERLATSMDIPFQRRRDAGWILRNAPINNADHMYLEKIIKIAKLILSHEGAGNG